MAERSLTMDWGFDLPDHFDGLDALPQIGGLHDHLLGHLDVDHDGISDMSNGVLDIDHDGISESHGGIVDFDHDRIPEMSHGVLDVNHDGIPESHNGVIDINHDGISEGSLAVDHVDPFLDHDLGAAGSELGFGSLPLPDPFSV